MITVLFFAKYREQLGLGRLPYDLVSTITVSDLKMELAKKGDQWSAVLNADNTICAVNQVIASDEDMISDGDEVAFYPPVTGG
ncbi:Molybdopterin synthase sulfur carrier subunit [Zhongshania aliphaticivorans]|uniref:Molybdopterin synthase sulfur carrier subunit n=1 Tax=Zhongshania aliphaticivorans TaxID=1470434 RepID=A0A5S9NGA3_9GAMM|nr:molybdopterin converting factor subunit 1 [Zhongshania aliphaticivorans]CAA0088595.1 Molybdopterin synthase sulfur carrier subunit [Zhongshania aliphaticivorans]CAA0094700.1 Molybdopterin synthase sulfur carrier subunit [Zhongshania aliphaticivorans]